MSLWTRLLGICRTRPPADSAGWIYVGGKVEIDLGRTPELKERAGAVRLEGNGLPTRVLVFRGDDGRFHAIENRCTHAGRRIDPLPGQSAVQCCSVGRTTYDYQGHRLSGSGRKPLPDYPVTEQDGRLTITLTRTG